MPLSKDGMGWWLFSPCALPMTEGTQAVGDIELYYRMGGSGPPLLLLHGMTRTGREWDPWLDELGERYTVIVPDLPGHGRSTRPSWRVPVQRSGSRPLCILGSTGSGSNPRHRTRPGWLSCTIWRSEGAGVGLESIA